MESIWMKNVQCLNFDKLRESKNTDVLIIGGGIAGILTAYQLKKAGIDCILVEADKICGGVSGYTTAKITYGHGLIYSQMLKNYGKEKTSLYLDAQIKSLEEYNQLCSGIDCDYQIKDSYVYSLNNCNKIYKEISALNSLGINAQFSEANELPFKVSGAVRLINQAQFHPLKFLNEIAKNLPIYENTKVTEFYPHKVATANGEIRFKKLIVATHFPIFNKHGSYFIKLYQHRSYVVALKQAQVMEGMYVDECDSGFSFRSYKDMLLLGGGGHRTGKQGGCWHELESFAEKYYKSGKIVSKWATQDCMTLDGLPYIGQYSKSTPNIYVATGFNKWGMSNAMVASHILCDLITEKSNAYSQVFSPSRSILHPQLVVNAVESTLGLLNPIGPRCPHLGCALKYNKAEHTWDCPCHGSRFTEKGKLIDNPATDDKLSLNK